METDLSYDEYLKMFHDILRKKIISDNQKTRKKGFDLFGNVLSSNYADSDVELKPPSILLNLPELQTSKKQQLNLSKNRLVISLFELIEHGVSSEYNLTKLKKQLEIFLEESSKFKRIKSISEKELSDVNVMIISLRKTLYDLQTKISNLNSRHIQDSQVIFELIETNQEILKVSKQLDELVNNTLTEQDKFIIDQPAKIFRGHIRQERIKLTN